MTGYASVVEKCANYGNVSTSDWYVGGVVGIIDSSTSAGTATVTYCYNSGSVKTNYQCAGGIVGLLYGDGDKEISMCYNKGSISGAGSVGSILGKSNTTNTTFNNLYYLSSLNLVAIAGVADDDANNIKAVDDDLNTYDEFISWIEQQ